MSRTWLYADPHFFQESICRFTGKDGNPLRPWSSAEEMSEQMISWYNELVHPEDRVYILGDVAMNRRSLDKSLPRLMGRKILVKGNHDTDKLSYYSQYFDDIRAVVSKKGFVLTHVPIHPASIGRWGLNIHGHIHDGFVSSGLSTGTMEPKPDKRYRCVSVEHTNFRPVLLDEILIQAGVRE